MKFASAVILMVGTVMMASSHLEIFRMACPEGPTALAELYGLSARCLGNIAALLSLDAENPDRSDLNYLLEATCTNDCFGLLHCSLRAEGAQCFPEAERFQEACARASPDEFCVPVFLRVASQLTTSGCSNLSTVPLTTAEQCLLPENTACTAEVEAAIEELGCCVNMRINAADPWPAFLRVSALINEAVALLQQIQTPCHLGGFATNRCAAAFGDCSDTGNSATPATFHFSLLLLPTILAAQAATVHTFCAFCYR